MYAFLIAPLRATCSAYLIILDLICLIIFDEHKICEAYVTVNGSTGSGSQPAGDYIANRHLGQAFSYARESH
jgi:hypothetical protein